MNMWRILAWTHSCDQRRRRHASRCGLPIRSVAVQTERFFDHVSKGTRPASTFLWPEPWQLAVSEGNHPGCTPMSGAGERLTAVNAFVIRQLQMPHGWEIPIRTEKPLFLRLHCVGRDLLIMRQQEGSRSHEQSHPKTIRGRWKSAAAREAAAGDRPGLPQAWEMWASEPVEKRSEEVGFAIFMWIFQKSLGAPLRERYEEAATDFDRAAKKANDLAFQIRAEFARERDEGRMRVYIPGKPAPEPFVAGNRVRRQLHRLLVSCRAGAMLETIVGLRSLTIADVSMPDGEDPKRPETWCNDPIAISQVALNLRRISDLYRSLARTIEKRKGRCDVERLKLIRFARKQGIPLRVLARSISEMGISASGEQMPDPKAMGTENSRDDGSQTEGLMRKRIHAISADVSIPNKAEREKVRREWVDKETAIWEDRLRSAEKGQRRTRTR